MIYVAAKVRTGDNSCSRPGVEQMRCGIQSGLDGVAWRVKLRMVHDDLESVVYTTCEFRMVDYRLK